MSSSDNNQSDRSTGTLTVTAPLGVEIEVLDGTFRPVSRGAGTITMTLADGLYSVVWSAAGRCEERLVRVPAGDSVSVDGGKLSSDSAPPSLLGETSDLEKLQFDIASSIANTDVDMERVAKDSDSELVVFVRSGIGSGGLNTACEVQLIDRANQVIPVVSSDADVTAGVENALASKLFHVAPGSYFLQYVTTDGRRVEQTVFTFEGRRTLAFLKCTVGLFVGPPGKEGNYVSSEGIDPTSSTFVSIRLGERLGDLDEVTRLADILLHKLVVGQPLNDLALLETISKPDADPFMKLYAATALLDPRAVAASNRSDIGAEATEAKRAQPVTAQELLGSMPHMPKYPDIQCIEWEIGSAEQGVDGEDLRLQVPPMLETCWRWASAASFDRSIGVEQSPSLVAASHVTQSCSPWLVWSADEQPGVDEKAVSGASELWASVERLATTANARYQAETSAVGSPTSTMPASGFALSDATIDVMNAAVAVVSSAGDATPEELAKRVAFRTGTPKVMMRELVDAAIDELSRPMN